MACSFPHIDISTFSRRLVLSGYILSSALQTVFLVVLEHPSTFLAAVVCTVSKCYTCTNFAFPSHIYVYGISGFGSITFIRIRRLVSRCESVGIASILPTCAYPFLSLLLCVHPKSIILRSLRQGTYARLRSVIHLLPTSI